MVKSGLMALFLEARRRIRVQLKLKWTPEDMQAKPPSGGDKPGTVPVDLANGLSVFAALQEQLGLKLEPRKVPAEVLIDHAEKASEN
jgi:uncharacterized protein (TIGR03435 family)